MAWYCWYCYQYWYHPWVGDWHHHLLSTFGMLQVSYNLSQQMYLDGWIDSRACAKPLMQAQEIATANEVAVQQVQRGLQKWQQVWSLIKVNGVKYSLGLYYSEAEAGRVVDAAHIYLVQSVSTTSIAQIWLQLPLSMLMQTEPWNCKRNPRTANGTPELQTEPWNCKQNVTNTKRWMCLACSNLWLLL